MKEKKNILRIGVKLEPTNDLEKWSNKILRNIGTSYRLCLGPGRGNAGDTAIHTAFNSLYEEIFEDYEADFMNCMQEFKKKHITKINQYDALFVGGHGLFLHDSYPNDISDWYWGITPELIEQIEIPIFVYSVGYNNFEGQREFRDIFDESVSALAEESDLSG